MPPQLGLVFRSSRSSETTASASVELPMKTSPRQFLIEALKDQFVPLTAEMGWISRRPPSEFDGPELRRASPLGYFRRQAGDTVHATDIYFDKRSPRFRVSIGTLPSRGMPSVVDKSVIVPPEALDAQCAPDGRLLRPGIFWGASFSYPLLQAPSRKVAQEVVQSLVRLWPQVEDYFETGRVGRNLIEGSGSIMTKQLAKMKHA